MSQQNNDFRTIILRFRDLVTNKGGTIDLHKKIADEEGAVWWGWWKKSGETAPQLALGFLSAKAEKQVLLFDSGHNRLYWATYNKIEHKNGVELASPSPKLTPAYYRDQMCEAWFRFTSIEEVPEDVTQQKLQGFAYARRDEFFKDGTSRYGVFYDKVISSCDELREQDRTMWFIREVKESDRRNEVRLLRVGELIPSHFPATFVETKSQHLLWLSDLHFSIDGHHAYAVEDDVPVGRATLGTRIEGALKAHDVRDLGGIIVSGDMTWRADPSEFLQFERLLARIATSPSKLDNYRIAIAPGNHDLAFCDTPSDKTSPVTYTLAEAKKSFSATYSSLFYIGPNDYCCSGRRFLLGNYLPVEIACLNSSVLQQAQGWFQGHGYVGEAQLRLVADSMGWGTEPTSIRPVRVLVLHHHLMPVVYREDPKPDTAYSVTLDAEAIVRFVVQHQIKLVLHGHMHENFFAEVIRKVDGRVHRFYVAGLGSSGVSQDHRRSGYGNRIGVLTFEGDRIRVRFVPLNDAAGASEESCAIENMVEL